MNTIYSETELKTKEHNKELIAKYDRKTIRVDRKIYTISVDNYRDLLVTLIPKTGGDEARSDVESDSYCYEMGGRIFKKAVDAAKEISEEIETGMKTDFIREVEA